MGFMSFTWSLVHNVADSCTNAWRSTRLMKPMHIDKGSFIVSGEEVMKIWSAFAEILDQSEYFILRSVHRLIICNRKLVPAPRDPLDTARNWWVKKKKKYIRPDWNNSQNRRGDPECYYHRHWFSPTVKLPLASETFSLARNLSKSEAFSLLFSFYLFILCCSAAWSVGAQTPRIALVSGEREREKEHMTSTFGFVLGRMTNCVYIYSINRCWRKDTGSAVRYSRPYVS